MSVADNVAYPLRLRKIPKAEIAKRVHEALAMVELAHLAERYPHQLSGGQQQRVALARAITYGPGVLLLDEPLSNLDAKLREQARVWLKEFQTTVGLTTIFVTHDQDEALALSDRIIVMNDGHIEQIGQPEEIYRRPGSPFVASFLGSANLVPATVVGSADGVSQARLKGSTQTVSVLQKSSSVEVLVMVRPEDVELVPGSDVGNPGDLRGRVTSRTFVGSSYRYLVDCDGQTISVTSRERWDPGPVGLRFTPDKAQLFAASPPASAHSPQMEASHA